MNSPKKPYECLEKNCGMSFVNIDRLVAHQKKHFISLNLDLKIDETGDQTPTPTSFFRNCEEVGLFQDLQNVNPFDETFKKALENAENQNGTTASLIPPVSNEDTLHTPHVFPTLEETQKDKIEGPTPTSIEVPQVNGIENNATNFIQKVSKKKLKDALLCKDKLRNVSNEESKKLFITLMSMDDSNVTTKMYQSDERKRPQLSLEKIREMNRAAQMRCRAKKKKQMDRLCLELEKFKQENSRLKTENLQMRAEINRLRENSVNLLKKIEELGGWKEEEEIPVVDFGKCDDLSLMDTLLTNQKNVTTTGLDENKVSLVPKTEKAVKQQNGRKVPIPILPQQPIVCNVIQLPILKPSTNITQNQVLLSNQKNISTKVKISRILQRNKK